MEKRLTDWTRMKKLKDYGMKETKRSREKQMRGRGIEEQNFTTGYNSTVFTWDPYGTSSDEGPKPY